MKNPYSIIVFFFSVVLFLWVQQAKVKLSGGDSELTLLSAQSIIENGTIGLNEYFSKVNQDEFAQGSWKYRYNEAKQQIEYIYPIGNVLLTIPFVYLANALGYDMLLHEHDQIWQSLLAGMSCVLVFLLLLQLLKLLVNKWESLWLALLFSWGTTLMSTCGAAFWSFNTELIFLLLLLIPWIKTELDPHTKPSYYFSGLYLFMAWLCRPSAMVFVGLFMLWRLLKRDFLIWRSLAVILALFGCFSLLSISWYGTWLPFYYNPLFWQSMPKTVSLGEGVLLVLFSPARGLFVFSPFLVLSLGVFLTKGFKQSLAVSAIAWIVVYLLVLGNLSNWWGGWCFGPRLATDLLPAFVILMALTLNSVSKNGNIKRVWLTACGVLGFLSVYFHSILALHNPATFAWNDFPAIDAQSAFYKWNWNYPQFAASEQNNLRKRQDFEGRERWRLPMANIPDGAAVLFGNASSSNAILLNIWNKEKVFGNKRLFGSINQLKLMGVDTFYFFEENYNALSKNEEVGIMPYRNQSLKELCERHKNNIVVAISKGNQMKEIAADALTHMENRGLRIMNKEGAEILWILNKDLLVDAQVVNDGKIEKNLQVDSLSLTVLASHEQCSLKLGDKELSINHDGISIMILNSKGELLETCYLDRYTGSTVWSTMNLKGYLKRK